MPGKCHKTVYTGMGRARAGVPLADGAGGRGAGGGSGRGLDSSGRLAAAQRPGDGDRAQARRHAPEG